MLHGQKRAGDGSSASRREKRWAGNSYDVVPHYSPSQLTELVKLMSPERASTSLDAAAEAFATLGESFKEVFATFCSQTLEYYPEEAEKAWDSANRHAFKSCAEAIQKLLSWALEDNADLFQNWLIGNVPEVALRKYREGDRGLAEITGVLLGDTLKASVKTGKRVFYLYEASTTAWTKIADCEVKRLVSHALEGVLYKVLDWYLFTPEADHITNEDGDDDVENADQKIVNRLIEQVRCSGKMGSILSLAQDLFIDEDFVAKLDSVSHLLAVQNGVIDLKSGELRLRTPEDKISTVLPIRYDPQVDDPWIRDTIKTIMADEEGMMEYLQKLLGYCITGDISEDVFIVFTNSGSNGRDVIMGALQALLGDFFRQMDNDIIGRGGSRSNTKIKKGFGGRIWSFSETDDNERFNSSTVKQLSGGNILTIGMEDVAPRQKCILTTNHVPQLGMVTNAVTRRLLIVSFPVTFRTFADGAVAWYKQPGLKDQAPAPVTKSINEYLQSQDLMAQFIVAKCEQGRGFWVLTDDFLKAYNKFFGFEELSFRELSRRMEDKPFLKKQVPSAGSRLGYYGLRLKVE